MSSFAWSRRVFRNPPGEVAQMPTKGLNWTVVTGVLCALALIGTLYLAQPFYDDQAVFIVGAQRMNQGLVLYRDYWDVKQPGIFIFYLLAGRGFGFTEVGIHTFELLYLLALSLVLSLTLKSYYRMRGLAETVPFLTVGMYYGVAGITQLGQVEGLVCFPLFLTIWFAYSATEVAEEQDRRLMLSGLFGGIAVVFKLMFGLMAAVFWATTLLYLWSRKSQKPASATRNMCAVSLGAAIPLIALSAYFAHFGLLKLVYYSVIVFPQRAFAQIAPSGPGRLADSVQWFVMSFSPVLVLALVGSWTQLGRRKDLLTVLFLEWMAVGAVVILLQRMSWWRYQFMLFFLPLGILAGKGLEFLWEQFSQTDAIKLWRRQYYVFPILVLAFLFSPVLVRLAIRTMVLARYHFAMNPWSQKAYQSDQFLYPDSLYPLVRAETGFLSRKDSLPGAIYVLGNPLFYFLSGRAQALPLTGGFELYLPEQWNQLATELDALKPAYFFVATSQQQLFDTKAGAAKQVLRGSYRVLQQDSNGTWYMRNETAAP